MGDVLVKSRADTEAERQAEAAASFEDKGDRRDLPTPVSMKRLPTFRRTYTAKDGSRKKASLESLVIMREKNKSGRDLNKEIVDAEAAGDTNRVTSIKNEINDLVYAELDDDEKRRVEDIIENNKRYEQSLLANVRDEDQKEEQPRPGIGVPEAAKQLGIELPEDKPTEEVEPFISTSSAADEALGIGDPSKRKPVAVKDKPKLSRRRQTLVGVEGRAQEAAEAKGLDFDLLQTRALNEIKRMAREQGIPVPSEESGRGLLEGDVDPRYRKLVEDKYQDILEGYIVGRTPTAEMRLGDEDEGRTREVGVLPRTETAREVADEERGDKQARDDALVAIYGYQQQRRDALAEGNNDLVAVLDSAIEEEAKVFPPAVREDVMSRPVSLNRLAEMLGGQAMQTEATRATKRDKQIDRLESMLNEPYIIAGDGKGNIDPVHAMFNEERIKAQMLLREGQETGDQAKIDEAKNALNVYFQMIAQDEKVKEQLPVDEETNNRIQEIDEQLRGIKSEGRTMTGGLMAQNPEDNPEVREQIERLEQERQSLLSSRELPKGSSGIMRNVPAGLGGRITMTPQGFDIASDIAAPVPARQFFLDQLSGRPTAGARSAGGRGVGRDLSAMSMRDATVLLNRIGPTLRHNIDETNEKRKESGLPPLSPKDEEQMLVHWDFKHDPTFVAEAEALGLEVPSYREAFQQGKMLAENQAGRSSDARKFRGRTDTTQRRQLDRLMKESIARFLAQHITTPEGAREVLGFLGSGNYATFMPADRPELIADFDPEIENKKLQKLLEERAAAEEYLANQDPEKRREIYERRQNAIRQKEHGMTERAIQRAAENYALGKSGMLDAMKGIGFGGKSADEMREAQALIFAGATAKEEADMASFLGNDAEIRQMMKRIQFQLQSKYGYPPNYIEGTDIGDLYAHADELTGRADELNAATQELKRPVEVKFREIYNQMQAFNEGAGGAKPMRIGSDAPLPTIDMNPDVPKKERGFDIEQMEMDRQIALEQGDTRRAAELLQSIRAARAETGDRPTLDELEDRLREAENSALAMGIKPSESEVVRRIMEDIRGYGKEKTTFTGMGDNTRTRVDFGQRAPPTRVGQAGGAQRTHGEILEEVSRELENRGQEIDIVARELGAQRDLGMSQEEFAEMPAAAQLSAEQRSREGLRQASEALLETARPDDKTGFLQMPDKDSLEAQVRGRDKRLDQTGPKGSLAAAVRAGEAEPLTRRTGAETDSKARLLGMDKDLTSSMAQTMGPKQIQALLSDPRVQALGQIPEYQRASQRDKIDMMQAVASGALNVEDLQPAAAPAPTPPPAPEPAPTPPPAAPPAQGESAFAGEPPNPLSAMQQQEGPVNVFPQEQQVVPMDTTAGEQPEVIGEAPQPTPFATTPQQPQLPPSPGTQITEAPAGISQEQLAAMIQELGLTDPAFIQSLAGKSVEEVQQEVLARMMQKSEPMRRFDATVGDDLLKSIKDRIWRQGY